MSAAKQDRHYKRSWKNLLINKRYQLQFTLFMVGLSTVLMVGLGVWVMRVANETTTVSMASVRGTPCPRIPVMTMPDVEEPTPVVPMRLPEDSEPPEEPTEEPTEPVTEEPTEDPTEEPAEPGEAGGTMEPPPVRTRIQIDESSMTMMPVVPKVPPDLGSKVVAHWTCELRLAGQMDQLERGRRLILYVLIGTGLVLVFGLAIYGIKMTHKVAGPLFKVTLYLAKMRDGRYDKVWNLRKGDQLVDFYEHFKTAHGGVVQMQHDDIAKIKAVIAAAETAGAGEHATVVELRELLAKKEKSVE